MTFDVDYSKASCSTVVFYHIQVAHLAVAKKCILEHSKKFVSIVCFATVAQSQLLINKLL